MSTEIFQYLLKQGLPEHTALAVMDNFQSESGMNAGINEVAPLIEGSRGGRGLYQLTGPRRNQFESQYGTDYNWQDQVDFMLHEGATSEKGAWDKVLAAPDRESAVRAMTTKFLRPAVDNSAHRIGSWNPDDPSALSGSNGVSNNARKNSPGAQADIGYKELPDWAGGKLQAGLADKMGGKRMAGLGGGLSQISAMLMDDDNAGMF